jgi:transposase
MAKTSEHNKAVKLRQGGKSIKNIAKILNVSKGTASAWCKDIELTPEQIEKLHKDMVRGSYAGRLKGAELQHERRIKREKEAEIAGINEIGKLSKRDLLIALVALYWGEGSKKKRELFIINSDPEMVKFLLYVFKELFKIEDDRFALGVGINIIHRDRDEEVKDYWSKITGVPKSRFRKTIFSKSKNKKNYDNFHSYYGMLRINISKSIDLYNKIMGLIKGLTVGLK